MYHIKDRPDSFDRMVGNESEVKSLAAKMLDSNRPHVYLFHGPSGVGKTTLARICATMLGANDLSIIERNISNDTGVDSAREIIQDLFMSPMGESNVKVYILDEVDRASAAWQASMKKPLEDLPSFVYFFLCTEFVDKIHAGIKTRAAKYSLSLVSNDDLVYLVKRTCREHEKSLPETVIRKIAEVSNGSPRDALVRLEQVLDMENESDMLDILVTDKETPEIRELCRALLDKGSWGTVSKLLKEVKEEPETIRRTVLGYMNAVLLNSGSGRAFDIIEVMAPNIYDSGKAGLTAMCFELTT